MPINASFSALDGSKDAPSFTFLGRPNTGLFYDAGNSELCVSIGGTTVARFDSGGLQLTGIDFLSGDVAMAFDDWTVTMDDMTWTIDAAAWTVASFSVTATGNISLIPTGDCIITATDDLLVTCESTVITATGDVTFAVTDDIIATCESASVTATGDLTLAITDDIIASCDAFTVTSVSTNALAVGRLGATTPVLQVDASTSTQAAGVTITGAASGSGVAFAALGGAAEPMSINAKGTGALSLQSVATGGLKIGTSTAECAVIKGIYLSAVIAVTVPSFAAETSDSVVVDVAAAFTVQPAVGDAILAIPQAALPTDCLQAEAYITATDMVTVTFDAKEGGGVTGAAVNYKFLLFDIT